MWDNQAALYGPGQGCFDGGEARFSIRRSHRVFTWKSATMIPRRLWGPAQTKERYVIPVATLAFTVKLEIFTTKAFSRLSPVVIFWQGCTTSRIPEQLVCWVQANCLRSHLS